MAKNTKTAPAMADGPDNWQKEEDLRTMLKAHEIKKDKKRHGAVKKLAKEKLAAHMSVLNGQNDTEDAADNGSDEGNE